MDGSNSGFPGNTRMVFENLKNLKNLTFYKMRDFNMVIHGWMEHDGSEDPPCNKGFII